MAYLLSRNSRIEEDLIDQLFNSSEKRLARLLLLLANFGKEGTPQPIAAHVSQETLAEMVGTTRSRVSSFMNKFRKLGFISYNGKIEVHNSLLNAILYDKPEIKREATVLRPRAEARGWLRGELRAPMQAASSWRPLWSGQACDVAHRHIATSVAGVVEVSCRRQTRHDLLVANITARDPNGTSLPGVLDSPQTRDTTEACSIALSWA